MRNNSTEMIISILSRVDLDGARSNGYNQFKCAYTFRIVNASEMQPGAPFNKYRAHILFYCHSKYGAMSLLLVASQNHFYK